MPFNLGIGEVLLILVVALIIFGGRLPEVGRSLGRSLTEFKRGLKSLPEPEEEEEGREGRDDSSPDRSP